MRWQFGSIGMLETTDNFEFMRVVWFGTPQILIDKGQIFLNRWREVIVILDEVAHSFSLEILYLIQDDIDSLVKIAFLFALSSVQLSVEL